MEETRQHSALSAEQRLFAAIYHAGSFALLASICLQVFRRIDALFPTILVVGGSRIALATWQLFQRDSSMNDRTATGLISTMLVWGATIVLLIWARWYGAGA